MIKTLSLSTRVLINAEALNMVEAVGNYTRHRKAPFVLSAGGKGYSVIYVPAVSGESIAHAYQQILTQIAKSRNLPVTAMDELGYYIKFSDNTIIAKWYKELAKTINTDNLSKWLEEAEVKDIEKAIIKTSVVADICGFLYTDKQVKRTSPIKFSYMLPTIDAVEQGGAAILPQLHTRYVPPTSKESLREKQESLREKQALIYIESSSAMYSFTAELVVSDIARLFYNDSPNPDPDIEKNKNDRIEVAVEALIALVDGMLFGAKRSRYMPLWDIKSMVVAVSSGPIEFVVSPGQARDYIKKTYERAEKITSIIKGMSINIFVYNGENLEEPAISGGSGQQQATQSNLTYEKTSSHIEALKKAYQRLLQNKSNASSK